MVSGAKEISEDDSNLLVVIIDTNPFVWDNNSNELNLDTALAQIVIFINAHLALKHDNSVAVVAAHVGTSAIIYPPTEAMPTSRKRDATMYRSFRVVDDAISADLSKLFDSLQPALGHGEKGTSMIAGALSMALAYINRIVKADDVGHIKPRILIVSVSPDSAYQYIPIMNCIFSAQKMQIPIDVCKVLGKDTVFLQQAAHITNGTYMHLDQPAGLLKYLMTVHLPDRFVRNYMHLPGEDQVDFRAACFCHRRIIDIGYVCSVCLSIFCEPIPVCSTCRTKFPIKTLSMFRNGGKPSAPVRRPAPPRRPLSGASTAASPAPSPVTNGA